MSMTSDIRRVQRRAEGGAVHIVLTEGGVRFSASIYPTRAEAGEMVADKLKEKGIKSVDLAQLGALVEAELRDPLYKASGNTLEEALSLLGKEVANDAQ